MTVYQHSYLIASHNLFKTQNRYTVPLFIQTNYYSFFQRNECSRELGKSDESKDT